MHQSKRVAVVTLLTILSGVGPMAPPASAGVRAAILSEPGVVGKRVAVSGGSYRDVAPRQLSILLRHKTFKLVNVHIPYAGEIAHTDLFIPFDTFGRALAELPSKRGAMIVLYCRSGRMSDIAARQLVRLGYTNIWNLAGGMIAWQQQGLPLLHMSQRLT